MKEERPLRRIFRYYLQRVELKQEQLAAELGIDPTNLSKMVNQHIPWTIPLLTQACDRLGIHDDERQEVFVLAGLEKPKAIDENLKLQATKAPSRVPLEPPPLASHFIDRDDEIALILNILQPGQMVTLWGASGMGKSAIVAKVVQHLAPDGGPPKLFPDGIVFYTFYGDEVQKQADSALMHIVLDYEEQPAPTAEAAARRVLANRQMLLILDGTEWTDNLMKVLSVRGNKCGVLLTSQRREVVAGEVIEIGTLPFNHAKMLLQILGGKHTSDERAIQRIYDLVGGLTLAINLIGYYLRGSQREKRKEGILDYLSWLEQKGLDALDFGKRRLESVPVLLEKSVSHISEVAQQLLIVTGILALAPIDREVLAAALDVKTIDLMHPLWELVTYRLLIREEERYRVHHSLIHTFAREGFNTPEANILRAKSLIRLSNFYAQFVKEQMAVGVSGHKRINVERAHIVALLTECAKHEKWEEVLKLAAVLQLYFYNQGFITDSISTYEAALSAARALGNSKDEIVCLMTIGSMYAQLGELPRATEYYQEGTTLARKIDDHHSEMKCLQGFGLIQFQLGHLTQANEIFQQTLRLARNINDRNNERESLFALGGVYQRLGQLKQAAEFFHQGIEITRELGDEAIDIKKRYLIQLAIMYQLTGELSKAIECYQESLISARSSGDRQNEGLCLASLGTLYQKAGQFEQATDYYQQALNLAHEIDLPHVEGVATSGLGDISYEFGELEKAIESYKLALAAARKLNNQLSAKTFLDRIGYIYSRLNQPHRAAEYYQQALLLTQELESLKEKIKTYSGLADTYQQLRQLDNAEHYYKLRLEISPDTGFFALVSLGIIARQQGKDVEANKFFEKALTVWSSTLEYYPELTAFLYETRAIALLCLGQEEEALNNLQASLPHRQKNHTFDVTDFELLAEAPNPPRGLSRLRSLYQESFKKSVS
jgi:tetratricopeptide (TPR) repeat protein